LLSHKSINQIIRLAHHGKLSGQVLRKLQKKIRHNSPGFGSKRKGKTITIKVKGGKCGSKFFGTLKHLMKKYHQNKSKQAMRKIRKYMKKHFKVSQQMWQGIKASIKKGGVNTKAATRKLLTAIKNHIPRKHIKKHHWTQKHMRDNLRTKGLERKHFKSQSQGKKGSSSKGHGKKKKPWWHFW